MELLKIHDVSILQLFGEISVHDVISMERLFASLRKTQHHKVILDMGSVDHIHYRVVKKLIEEAGEFRKYRGDLKIINLNPQTKEIFRFIGADQLLEDYENLLEGVLSFSQQTQGEHVYQ